ncbi:MAG: PqqD family protein [Eubacterium sp.]
MSKKEKKPKENYLDMRPFVNPEFKLKTNDDGIIVIEMKNKGFYNKLAQKIFNKPAVSNITLDEYGTFIFNQMDGVKNIYEISKLVDEKFGESAHPLLERLVKYFRILKNNDFICYKTL